MVKDSRGFNPERMSNPCNHYSNEEKCSKKCKECYIVHMNNLSWFQKGKLFKFVKNNFVNIIILLLILTFIYKKKL